MTQIKLSKCEDLPHGGFIYYDKAGKRAFVVKEGALFYVDKIESMEDIKKAVPMVALIIEGALEPSWVIATLPGPAPAK